MSASLYSPSWYRVSQLKPRLRSHVAIHRQRFRGATWYVIQDHQTGRFHRLSPAAHYAICLMDGRRTVERIWEMVADRLGEDQPSQEELVRLLSLLHAGDLLRGDLLPDMSELSERSQTLGRSALFAKLRNPMALRLPLIDPERFLAATLPFVRPLFSVAGFIAWLALVLVGLSLAIVHWSALVDNISDQAFIARNFLILVLVYPVLKTLHELGHAYATKVWGGEVHEMGIMLMVFVPVLYVDASASTAFREKWRRALVGGAGILVEMALAALAIILWVYAEPGLVRAVAFNVALIGGISTLLFNGNPLLRFDGYYVLSDLLEIPNLASRGNQYVFYLVRRHAFGLREETPPVVTPGEGRWLASYAIASFCYRMAMMSGVALFIASRLFFIGVVLAISAMTAAIVWPTAKGLWYVISSPQLTRHRRRALGVTAGAIAILAFVFFIAPIPYATMSEGIVWIGDQSTLRAPVDGFITAIDVPNGATVTSGETLIVSKDPTLVAQHDVLESQLEELHKRLEAVPISDVVQARLLREQIRHMQGAFDQTEQQISDLTIKAGHAGRFLISDDEDLRGKFLHRGDLVGYLLTEDEPIVRTVISQDDADLVRRRTDRIDIRLADQPDNVVAAEMLRQVPAAIAELPHLALATTGGGSIMLDPAHTDKPRPLERLFHFDLRTREPLPPLLGERVYVRFDHGPEPLAFRIVRFIRQLFLRQFSV